MTQEEFLDQLRASMVEKEDLALQLTDWHEETRAAWKELSAWQSAIRDELTALRSSIEGAGGIVGKNVCDAREVLIDHRIAAAEKQHDNLVTWFRLMFIAVLGAAAAALFSLLRHK